jgi:acyl-CoA reductase-like NAD-dependent aldehyde dehydrogenase
MSMFQTVYLVDDSVYVERKTATAGKIDETLARKAQSEWEVCPVANRPEWCSRMIDAFVAQRDRIAEEITW